MIVLKNYNFFKLFINNAFQNNAGERGKLFDEVESEWIKRENKILLRQNASISENEDDEDDDSSDEIEECIVKVKIPKL